MNKLKDTVVCYVGMGGNFPETPLLMQQAVVLLHGHASIEVLRCSAIYATEPIEVAGEQNDFLNCVISCTTTLPLHSFFHFLQDVEIELGKKAKAKHAPRPIDLDLLFYGTAFHRDTLLQVPHLLWRERRFVVEPLNELTATVVEDGKIIELKQLLEGNSPLLQQRVNKAYTYNLEIPCETLP